MLVFLGTFICVFPSECPQQPLDLLPEARFKAHQQVFLFEAMVSSGCSSFFKLFLSPSALWLISCHYCRVPEWQSDSHEGWCCFTLTLIALMPNIASVQDLECSRCSGSVYYNSEWSGYELKYFQTKEGWIRRKSIPNYLPRENLPFKRELFHPCSRKLTLKSFSNVKMTFGFSFCSKSLSSK